jgi:hypothetical protein
MPSLRRQIIVRVTPETGELFDRTIPAVAAELGITVSQSDAFRLAVGLLADKFLAGHLDSGKIPKKHSPKKANMKGKSDQFGKKSG